MSWTDGPINPMNSLLDPRNDEALAVCDAVERYVRLELAPHCLRSETPIPTAVCRAVVTGLVDIGVLNLGEATGWGLWDDARAPLNRRVSIRTLQCLARQSPSIGYQAHLQALAAYLDRLAGVPEPRGTAVVSLQGHLGLGRDALAAALGDAALTPEQQAILGDNWAWPSRDRPRWLHALPDWTATWIATWDGDAGWMWRRAERATLGVEVHAHSLGLDELTTHAVTAPADGPRIAATATIDGPAARDALPALLAVHGAALLALSQSVAEVAWGKAREYARARYQGGQAIIAHVAVQRLLSDALGAAHEASQALERLGQAGADWPDLPALWRDRARCQVRLSAAASAALQVFGGLGYMRDNGMEKLLRHTAHLRLLGGSPEELSLCVAHWDAVRGESPSDVRDRSP